MKSLLKYLPIVVLVHLTASCAIAQIRYGTVVVVYYTDEKIIVAADSRQVATDPNVAPRDNACKIATPDGRMLFAAAGFADYEGNDGLFGLPHCWSVIDEIHRAYQLPAFYVTPSLQFNSPNILGLPVDPVLQIAKTFEMYESFDLQSLTTSQPEMVAQLAQKQQGILSEAIIGGLDANGQLVLFLTKLTYGGYIFVGSSTEQIKCDRSYCAIGEPDVAVEFVNLTSDRAKREAQEWKPPKGSNPQITTS